MKLLILKVNQLGDNVVFLPNVQDLQHRFPDWEIHLATSPSAAPIYEGLLPPEHLHIYHTHWFNKAWRHPFRMLGLLWTVRKIKPDAVIIAEDQSNVAHFLSRLSGAPLRVGSKLSFIQIKGGITSEVKAPPGKSIPWWGWLMRRRLLMELGEELGPEVPPPPDFSHLLDPAAPKPDRPFVLIHPGGSLPYKRWFLERFVELAGRLVPDIHVAWVAHDIDPPANLDKRIEIYRPASLKAFIQRLSQASLLVGNNSGPLHLGSAVHLPIIAFSGPSQPSWDPIWNEDRIHILRDEKLACLPCDSVNGQIGHCTNTEHPMACMEAWKVDYVEDLARRILKLNDSPA